MPSCLGKPYGEKDLNRQSTYIASCRVETEAVSTGTIFFTQKHKNIPFSPKKRYLWRSGWRSTVQGLRHTWTLKKNIVSHIVSFQLLNYSPSVVVVLLVVVLLLCCCCCLCLLCCCVANTANAATVGTPPPPPLLLVGVEVDVISLFGPSN